MTKKDRREAGFTLIELMIVLFILGLLAALVAPRLMGRVGKAKQKTAQAQLQLLATALDLYHLDVGRYPTTEEGLRVLKEKPDNAPSWGGGRIWIRQSPMTPGAGPMSINAPENTVPMILFPRGRTAPRGAKEKTRTLPTGNPRLSPGGWIEGLAGWRII